MLARKLVVADCQRQTALHAHLIGVDWLGTNRGGDGLRPADLARREENFDRNLGHPAPLPQRPVGSFGHYSGFGKRSRKVLRVEAEAHHGPRLCDTVLPGHHRRALQNCATLLEATHLGKRHR